MDDTTDRHLTLAIEAIRHGALGKSDTSREQRAHRDLASASATTTEAHVPAPRAGTVIRGTWTLSSLLGVGAFGLVYSAWNDVLDRQDAIKFLHPHLVGNRDLRRRFEREATLLAKLRGDHLVHVHDHGEHEGLPFFAMEHLRGQTLQQRLESKRPVTMTEFRQLATGILLGLAEIHAHGIVHRDVKPANIFVLHGTNHVKILDLGLATSSLRLTAKGTILGTPLYMAPELLVSSGAEASSITDVYSAGVVLYQLLSGHVPFRPHRVTKISDLLRQMACHSPRPLREHRPELAKAIEELVLCAIDKDPGNRPQSARAFAVALDEALESEGRHTKETITSAAGRVRRRHIRLHKRMIRVGMLLIMGFATRGSAQSLPRAPALTCGTATGMRDILEWDPAAWITDFALLNAAPILPEEVATVSGAEKVDTPESARIKPSADRASPAHDDGLPKNQPPRKSSAAMEERCKLIRQFAASAEEEWDWPRVLKHTAPSQCWISRANRENRTTLRIRALAELRLFEQCASLGRSAKDEAVRQQATICQQRAK